MNRYDNVTNFNMIPHDVSVYALINPAAQMRHQLSRIMPGYRDSHYFPHNDSEMRLIEIAREYDQVVMNYLNMDRHGYMDVYIHGACSNNGRTGASAGIGVYFPDHQELNVSRPIDVGDRQTNINAEIQAATEAARQASQAGVEKLQINTDCEFLVKCGTEWVPRWKENGWRKADGSAVVNQKELQAMDQAMRPLQVSWRHVPRHSRVHGNEAAVKLAREGYASSRHRY